MNLNKWPANVVADVKEMLQIYINKITLNKLTSEEIMTMMEDDIKTLREMDGDQVLKDLIT